MQWTIPPPRDAVMAAGAKLRGRISEQDVEEAACHFATANAWREAHLLPLHSCRLGLQAMTRHVTPHGLVAGRIKRLSSIRKKLRRTKLNLWDIQDLAGIRAIVPAMEDVQEIVRRYQAGAIKHRLAREDDYISAPKPSGYRSHHLMIRFAGKGDHAAFDKRAVEVQIRTRLQHAWATALEATGLIRDEDLKAGEGDPMWLRFFQIMSGELAAQEGQPPVPGVSADAKQRREELREIERALDAVATLESYNFAIQRVDNVARGSGGRFIIRFDRRKQTVTVTPFYTVFEAMREPGSEGIDGEAVVVEVDRIDSLAAAYPNYFGDVRLFTENLRSRVLNEPMVERLARRSPAVHALSWIQDWRGRTKRSDPKA